MDRMPCHITDGPDFDEYEEGVPGIDDLDEDEIMQREVDDLNDALRDIAKGLDTTPWGDLMMLREQAE